MAKCKKKDFVELEYTGMLKKEGNVFDTTIEQIAKTAGIFKEGVKYEQVVICIGQNFVVNGLDKELEGKEVGRKYKVEIDQEKGFGKKDSKLLKIISKGKFTKEKINPFPGLVVNVDGTNGMVRSVTSGRVIVDFNHPLAGKDLIYEFKIIKIVKDIKLKVSSVFKVLLGLHDFKLDVKEGNVLITIKNKMPPEIEKTIVKEVKKLIPEIKSMEFKVK